MSTNTLGTIRTNLVEDWLAEVSSSLYTPTVLNNGINWAYSEIAQAMGGVDATWDASTTITAPYRYAFPRDMVWLEKVSYNPSGDKNASDTRDLIQMTMDDAYSWFGMSWPGFGTGSPFYFVNTGWQTFLLYPRPGSVIASGITIYGKGMPDDLSGDSAVPLTPSEFDNDIGLGAFVYTIRRLGMHESTPGMPPHPLYSTALKDWSMALEAAQAAAEKIPASELVVAGTVPSRRRWPKRPIYDFEARGF